MDEIVEQVAVGTELDKAVDTFLSLSHTEKVSTLLKLGDLKSENAGVYLNKLYPRVAEKDICKLIKKALFRLKTRGIHVEEPGEPGQPVLRKIETAREERGFLSSFDGEGLRVSLVAAEARKNLFIFVHSVTRFGDGLVDLASTPVPRAELDALLHDYQSRAPKPIVLAPVSTRYAAYIIQEAGGDSAGRFENELKEIRPFMASLKGRPQKPEDLYDLAVAETARPVPFERLLGHSIFEPFQLTWPTLDEDRTAMEQAVNPGLFLPPHMVQERRGAFLDEMMAREKMALLRRSVLRMLEDYAYLLHLLKEFDYYKALIDGLREQKARDGLTLFFFEKALARKEPEQAGVLVSPYEQEPRR